jgi:hypothetical protein
MTTSLVSWFAPAMAQGTRHNSNKHIAGQPQMFEEAIVPTTYHYGCSRLTWPCPSSYKSRLRLITASMSTAIEDPDDLAMPKLLLIPTEAHHSQYVTAFEPLDDLAIPKLLSFQSKAPFKYKTASPAPFSVPRYFSHPGPAQHQPDNTNCEQTCSPDTQLHQHTCNKMSHEKTQLPTLNATM